MTATTSAVKTTAKQILKGKWIKSFAFSLILICSYLIVLYCSQLLTPVLGVVASNIIFALLCIFLLFPLFLGALRSFRRMQWGCDDYTVGVFHYFSSKHEYKRALCFTALMSIRVAAMGIVVYLPYIALALISSGEFYEIFGLNMPAWAAELKIVASVIGLASSVILLFCSVRYYLAPFLFVADEDMDPAEALLTSKIISRRSSYDFWALVLSLAPFLLLSLLLAPLIFLLPYFAVCYLVHCRYTVAEYNSIIERLNNNTPYYSVG